jgi:hypothetical protein
MGLTLVEMMVAFFLLSLISLALHSLLSDSARKKAIAEARSTAAQEADRVLARLTQDMSQAQPGTFRLTGSGDAKRFSLKLPPPGSSQPPLEIVYDFQKPVIKRIAQGAEHPLAQHVERLEIGRAADNQGRVATGQYLVEIKTAVQQDGLTTPETHHQQQVVAVRTEAAAANDPYWVGVGKINGILAGFDTALDSLVSDISALGSNIQNGVFSSAEDAYQKMSQVITGLTSMKDALNNIDNTLEELKQAPANIFSSANLPFPLIKEAIGTVALTMLKNYAQAGNMPGSYEEFVRKVAQAGGFSGQAERIGQALTPEFKKMFEKKKELLEKGKAAREQLQQGIDKARQTLQGDIHIMIPPELIERFK